MKKPKLSIYWSSSCGGCEVSLLNVHEKILELNAYFDLFFCPCLLDTKRADVEALKDGEIAVTLFNGAIRTSENEEMARLMRAKSQLLIAFGACASAGGIPALSNLSSRREHLRSNYLDGASTQNGGGILPAEESIMAEGQLELPAFWETVRPLPAVVEVDYTIPGCPPEPVTVWNAVQSLLDADAKLTRRSCLGGGISSVCSECAREKGSKTIEAFRRMPHTIPDAHACLADQGIVCMGMATRQGCGAKCPQVNVPCTGCYGAVEGSTDQGSRMIGALGAVAARTGTIWDGIPDPAGTFYKFALCDIPGGSQPR